jgi:hypothetical protein
MCWSVGQAFYSGAPIALSVNAISADNKSLRRAIVRWGQVARWIGGVLGGLVVLLGARVPGMRAIIVCAGATLVISAVYVQLRWPEITRSAGHRHGNMLGRIRSAWRPELAGLLVVTAGSMGLLSTFLFAWQPTVTSVLRLESRWLGSLLVGLTALAAIGSWSAKFTWARLARHHYDLWILLAVGGVLLSVMALSPMAAVIALIGVELITGYVLIAAATRAHGIFVDASRNLLWSVFSATMGAVMALIDLIFGQAWHHFGLARALVVAVGAQAVLCGLLWIPTSLVLGRRAESEPVPVDE